MFAIYQSCFLKKVIFPEQYMKPYISTKISTFSALDGRACYFSRTEMVNPEGGKNINFTKILLFLCQEISMGERSPSEFVYFPARFTLEMICSCRNSILIEFYI